MSVAIAVACYVMLSYPVALATMALANRVCGYRMYDSGDTSFLVLAPLVLPMTLVTLGVALCICGWLQLRALGPIKRIDAELERVLRLVLETRTKK